MCKIQYRDDQSNKPARLVLGSGSRLELWLQGPYVWTPRIISNQFGDVRATDEHGNLTGAALYFIGEAATELRGLPLQAQQLVLQLLRIEYTPPFTLKPQASLYARAAALERLLDEEEAYYDTTPLPFGVSGVGL